MLGYWQILKEHLSEQMTKRLEEKPGGEVDEMDKREVDERRDVSVGVCERLVRPIGGRGTAGTSVDNCQPIVGRGVESSEVGI